MNQISCDILIFGAGIIGASLALNLAQSGIHVVIVDKKFPIRTKKQAVPSIRVLAINYTSAKFLEKINIWQTIPSCFRIAYDCLEVWEWSMSKITFYSTSVGLKNMGYVIENDRLQSMLWKHLVNNNKINLYCPYILVSAYFDGLHWKCILNNGLIIISRLLIGADGTYSQIRRILGIKTTYWKYHQHCMLLTIKVSKNTPKTLWQMFTPNGPISFLPLYDNWGVLMWYDTPNQIFNLKNLPISFLEKKIEKKCYKKLGYVKLYNIYTSPLVYQRSHCYTALNGILIGDAARTIHPLAGQGINLGLRDVIVLSNLLINANFLEKHANISVILKNYQKDRLYDSFIMQTGINWLYTIFNNNFSSLKLIRNITFMMIEHSTYMKKQILKYALDI